MIKRRTDENFGEFKTKTWEFREIRPRLIGLHSNPTREVTFVKMVLVHLESKKTYLLLVCNLLTMLESAILLL